MLVYGVCVYGDEGGTMRLRKCYFFFCWVVVFVVVVLVVCILRLLTGI